MYLSYRRTPEVYEQGGWDVGLNHKGWRRKIVLGALRVKTKRVLKGIQKASDGFGRGRERGGRDQSMERQGS